VHGRPQEATVGGRTLTLYPLYHPAAALYTPAMLRTLEEDFARIPALIGEEPAASVAQVIEFPVAAVPGAATSQEQLGLF
jgi:DNA polymerase